MRAAARGGRWLFPAPPAPGVLDDRLRASRLWAQLKKAKKAFDPANLMHPDVLPLTEDYV